MLTQRIAIAPFLGLVLLSGGSAAQQDRNVSGGPMIAEQACYDVRSYALSLAVDPERQRIDGALTMTAQVTAPTRQVALDLDHDLAVQAVTQGPAALPFQHRDGRIWIELPEELAIGAELLLTVAYGGEPRVARNPPWSGGFTWARTGDGRPWIATSCQGEGADLWWPCKDHPSDKPDGMDLRITVPDGLIVASNGVLVAESAAGDDRREFHWQVRSPISNYCVALNIAPYEVIRRNYRSVTGEKVPFELYVLPQDAERARPFADQFLAHLRWFEETLGPYPFRKEKYGVAHTPHLGMEHQTIIAYGNGFRDQDYDWLHHHELAHEWWGNLVTCRDWKDMWIHEGFGTYMQALYLEHLRGPAGYAAEVGKWRALHRGPVAPRESRDSQQIYFGPGGSNDIYFKGALVLHQLRWLMGDDKFRQSLRRFCYPDGTAPTDGSQVRLVDTDEYVVLCSRLHGGDLGWYFEAMVRQPRPPRLQQELVDGVLRLRWEVPHGGPFPMPVPVRVGQKIVRVPMTGGSGEVRVGKADHAVDPDGWLPLAGRRR